MAIDLKKFLDSNGVSHLWGRITAKMATDIKAEETRAKAAEEANATAAAAAKSAADAAQADATQALADAKAAQDDVDAVEKDLGSVDSLSTTNKTVVGAINEVLTAVGTGGTAATVTITTDTTTDGALKSYTVKQGNTTVGVIDIPKDMVVESGEVVANPEGQAEGTYIKLVLANVAEPLYINVGRLVDIYTVETQATQVQLSIVDNKISAAIVAGSVTATELAANAVTTEKIADANVTKAKLSSEVQNLLDNAATKTELGEAEDRIGALEGKFGEGAGTVESQIAAALETAAADATAKANAAEANAKAASDAKGSAAQALTDAKAYTDAQVNAQIIALTDGEIDTAIGYQA